MADNHLIGTITMGEEIYGHLQNATLQGLSAYEVAVANGFTGTEAEWLASLKGETGSTPDISIGNVTTGQPGTNVEVSVSGTPENPVMDFTIPRGDVGATPNMTIGTVATGEEGTQAQATITGTPENPVLNLTIPRGDTGDAGFDPIVEVTKDGNTATVSVTDATHTTEVNIVDGYTPQKNVDYFDGHTPVITGAKSQGTTFIYSDGEQIGAIADGQDGYTPRKGVDYFDGHTPAISGEKIDDTTFIYADGVRIATVLDGLDGNSPVITTVKSGKTTSILADSVVIGTVSDGADGHSPTITTTKSGKTTTILSDGQTIGTVSDGADGIAPTITTNKSGTTTTIYSNGVAIGTVEDGADGSTPVITATKSEGITTIKANGIDIATINDGVAGDDGYSPTASVTKSGGISTLTVTDENGTTTTQILDGTGMIASDPNNDGNIVLSSVIGVQIDEEPTSGSTNAISSGSVYNELTDLKSDLNQTMNLEDIIAFSGTYSGTRYVPVSTYISTGTYSIDVVNITSSDTDRTTCLVYFMYDESTGAMLQLNRGDNIHAEVTLERNVETISFFASSSGNLSAGDTFSFTGFKVTRSYPLKDTIDTINETVTSAVSELGDRIDDVESDLSTEVSTVKNSLDAFEAEMMGTTDLSGGLVSGFYSLVNSVTKLTLGSPKASDAYVCGYFPCKPGDHFIITGTGASGAKLWAWCTSDGTIVSRSSTQTATDLHLTSETSADYLVVNFQVAYNYSIVQTEWETMYERNDRITTDVAIMSDLIGLSSGKSEITCAVLSGKYWDNYTGMHKDSSAWCCSPTIIPFYASKPTAFYSTCGYDVGIVCYGIDRKVIGVARAAVIGATNNSIAVPADTYYLGLNVHLSSFASISIKKMPELTSLAYPYGVALYLPDTVLNSQGSISSSSSFATAFFAVDPADRIYTNATMLDNIVCFSATGTCLGSASYTEIPYNARIYTVLTGAVYCGVNIQYNKTHGTGHLSTVYCKITKAQKILCIGDSITFLDNQRNTNYDGATMFLGWQKQLESAGYEVASAGFSGYTYAVVSGTGSIYTEIVTNQYDVSGYDIIILSGGTNDDYYGVPVGNIPTAYEPTYDTTTMCGALGAILAYIRSHNSMAKIILATQMKAESTARPFSEAKEYAEAIRDMANWGSCFLADNFNNMNTQPFSSGFTATHYDTVHPNKLGMEILGKLMLKAVENC